VRAREARDKETVNPVLNRSSKQFAERPRIRAVGALERIEVARAILLMDHSGRISPTHKEQVEHESPNATVPIRKRVDTLKLGV
jgi:hypothetical protein